MQNVVASHANRLRSSLVVEQRASLFSVQVVRHKLYFQGSYIRRYVGRLSSHTKKNKQQRADGTQRCGNEIAGTLYLKCGVYLAGALSCRVEHPSVIHV